MADIFLSYSSKDREAALRVRDVLTARGLEVFWDQETPPGQDWDSWIRTKLSNAKVAVVLWSKTSVQSPNVRHEAIVARDAGKLAPVMIEALQPSDFPMGLYLVQAVSLTDWRDQDAKGYSRLVAEVAARMDRPLTPPKAAPAKRSGAPAAALIGAFVAIVLAGGGGAWYLMKHKPDAPQAADVATGAAVAAPLSPASAPAATANTSSTETFGHRLLGHWRWSESQPCGEGPVITLEGDRLVFTTPGTRFVHVIETHKPLETATRVVEPESSLGEQYKLTPIFFATKDQRSFNLVVQNLTAHTQDTWTPCDLKN